MQAKFGCDRLRRQCSLAVFLVVALLLSTTQPARCEEMVAEASEPERTSPIQKLRDTWADWPPSENFKITLEYRNYTYFEDESNGDSRDSINEGRLRVEYDNYFRDNMRIYLNALLQTDDDDYTEGFMDDFRDNDLKRSHGNFPEAFLDIYFDDFDLRLGKQIISWGKADAVNPTDNINPTDYSNLLDDDDIGVAAVNFNYYWNDWNLQLVGVPWFTPSRLPPSETRFSVVPPGSVAPFELPFRPFVLLVPIEDPELPSDTIDNSQFGARLQTTYSGWDFSVSYYDGVDDVPSPTVRYTSIPILLPEAIVPVYNRFRAVGGDFATTFDRWGLHGEAAQIIYDGDRQDSYFQYVIGLDYTRSNILFDHDLFVIIEYVGEDVTKDGKDPEMESGLGRVLKGAVATSIEYEFTEYTKIEIQGAIDFDKGDDYYFQPQLVHQMTDAFEITVGLDLIGGPKDTFFGQFKDNDRVFVKLKYAF